MFFIFMFIAVGGFIANKRRSGQAKFAYWGAAAGLVTTILGIIAYLVDGLVNIETIVISMLVTTLFFFMTLFEDDIAF